MNLVVLCLINRLSFVFPCLQSYAFLHPHVRLDNRNFFKVYWEGGDDGYQADYPKNDADVEVGNSCGNNTCDPLPADGGGGCLCKTSIKRYAVFKDMPMSVDDALSKLTMGAFDTSAYDAGSYVKQDPLVPGITVYFAASGKPYDMETVFEVEDAHGRLLRFKNTKEVVRVGEDESYAFRNVSRNKYLPLSAILLIFRRRKTHTSLHSLIPLSYRHQVLCLF